MLQLVNQILQKTNDKLVRWLLTIPKSKQVTSKKQN